MAVNYLCSYRLRIASLIELIARAHRFPINLSVKIHFWLPMHQSLLQQRRQSSDKYTRESALHEILADWTVVLPDFTDGDSDDFDSRG